MALVEMATTPDFASAGTSAWPYQLFPQARTPPSLSASSCAQPAAIALTPDIAASGTSVWPKLLSPHTRTWPALRPIASMPPMDTALTPVEGLRGRTHDVVREPPFHDAAGDRRLRGSGRGRHHRHRGQGGGEQHGSPAGGGTETGGHGILFR